MAFDLHLIIPDNSPEGRVVAALVERDHVSPEEAVRRVLRDVAAPTKTPAEMMWGAFSSDEDSAIIDHAMTHVRALRETDQLRDFGI